MPQNVNKLRWVSRGATLVVVSLLLAMMAGHSSAQPRPGFEIRPRPRALHLIGPRAAAIPAIAPPATAAVSDDELEQRFPGGAALKTDAEQQRLLNRAEECVADGRLDLAAILWQRVLDEAGDTLMTHDGRTYFSLSEEVERTLADLDPLALKTYRITADGEAQAVLAKAGPDREEEALAEVVRRYFLSSHGDDAAYKLGCLALDRYDFVGAARMFSKIVERHPDPSMPQAELLLRLAVASARVADRETAQRALEQASQAEGPRPDRETYALVTAQVESVRVAGSSSERSDWHMAFGGPGRTGYMKSLPKQATSRTLAELWVQEFGVANSEGTTRNPWTGMAMPVGVVGRQRQANAGQSSIDREQLVRQWRENAWRPTPQLLFDRGKVFVKSPNDLAAYSTDVISNQPEWTSAWQNRYEVDSKSQMLMMIAANPAMQHTSAGTPKNPTEILFFGDRVHQQMSIAGGVLYSIEGRQIAKDSPANAGTARNFQWGVTPRRSRTNWLTAYDAQSGVAKWNRAASDEDKEGTADVGFLGSPVPFGNHLLLVPVTDGGTIYLYALKVEDGSTVWKSYLCDEPTGGCSAWSTVQIAVDGSDAYVTCGAGVVFAVDAATGTIRWAVRYARDGKPDTRMRHMYGHQQTVTLELSGWDDDLVIPQGRTLVVLSSDCDKLLALDRRTGEMLWDSPREEAAYCVGVHGRGLFVAGKNVVRRIDIQNGLRIWDREIDDSFGRGVVTGDALYMPVKDSILKLDLATGAELGQVGVSLTTDDPVGNLYSDGEKLWATGAGRIYAMTNLDHRLEMLEKEIQAGNIEAQFNRMRLHARQNDEPRAVADLRGAYELCRRKMPADEAATRLFDAIHELRLATRSPIVTLDLLTDLFGDRNVSLGKQQLAARSKLVASALNTIRQQRLAGGVRAVLRAAPLIEDDYLLTLASQAVSASVRPSDQDELLKALEQSSATSQIVAAGAAAQLLKEVARQPLQKLVASDDDLVRLAGARALLNTGDRGALQVLATLLESDVVVVRSRTHQTLRAVSGQQIAFAAEGKPEVREKGLAAWKMWLDEKSGTAELKLPLPDSPVALGRMLIASHTNSLVIEFDADRTERWRTQAQNPYGCQGLPNGHRLVAVHSLNTVIEYDAQGNEVWRKDRLPGQPYSVQRLENGNTLVACADAQQIVEITPDGETVAQMIQGRPIHAVRLDNGNTLVALQQGNRVVEIDDRQKVVWEARNLNGPSHAQRLENGNTLIVQMYNGQLVEIDGSGSKTTWVSRVALVNPMAAIRLPSGNTLVADNNGVHELDASGQRTVWTHRQNNVTGLSQF